MSLADINRETAEYNRQKRKDIKDDILECHPVNCEGGNIIFANDRIYYKSHVFYSFKEFFERMEINECTYNKKTYEIKES